MLDIEVHPAQEVVVIQEVMYDQWGVIYDQAQNTIDLFVLRWKQKDLIQVSNKNNDKSSHNNKNNIKDKK